MAVSVSEDARKVVIEHFFVGMKWLLYDGDDYQSRGYWRGQQRGVNGRSMMSTSGNNGDYRMGISQDRMMGIRQDLMMGIRYDRMMGISEDLMMGIRYDWVMWVCSDGWRKRGDRYCFLWLGRWGKRKVMVTGKRDGGARAVCGDGRLHDVNRNVVGRYELRAWRQEPIPEFLEVSLLVHLLLLGVG